MNDDTTTYKRIAAVKTTCQVLRCLAQHKGPLGAAAVAAGVGVPTGTAACHLATLEDEGLTRRVGDRWELSMGLALYWATYTSRARAQADRLTAELHDLGA